MGNLRQVPLTVKETHEGSNKRMNYVVSSMCGWRLTMEDAHIANPNFTKSCGLFAVFDGHGGAEVAVFASKFFEKELLKNQSFSGKKYQTALTETFQLLDKMLQTKQGEKELKKIKVQISDKKNEEVEEGPTQAGCTAVVCLVTETEIYCANAGDSCCMIYRKKVVENMSEDHKPNDPKEKQRIIKAGGTIEDGRICGTLNLSRALGDFEFKKRKSGKWDEQMVIAKPDIVRKPLQGTEYIVLGCDGIFQDKSNEEIMNIIRTKPGEKIKDTAQKLLDLLLAKDNKQEHGVDNMSIIIVKLKSPDLYNLFKS